jgi:O-antigen/teichoic acid export membrane protein
MNVQPIEPCLELETQRAGALPAAALRLQSAVRRLPGASQTVLSIFDQAIVSATGFLTVVLIGRMTSPDNLGLFYLVFSAVLIVTGIQDQVIAAPYAVYSKRLRGQELAKLSGSMWLHQMVLALLSNVLLLCCILWLATTGSTSVVPTLWALFGAMPFLLLRQCIRRFAFANFHITSVIPIDAIVAVAQLGGLALLGYFGAMTLFNIYAVMGASCALACVAWYLIDPPQVSCVRHRLLADWRSNWAFGRWALQGYLTGNTTPYLMVWILSSVAGTAATGVFGACASLIGMTNVLLSGVDNVLTPQAAHAYATGGAKNLQRVLLRSGALMAATVGAMCLAFAMSGDWLAVLLFGTDYQGTGTILFLLALSALANSIGMVAANGLWAIDRPRSNFLADVGCLAVTLITAAFLLVPLGPLGAALATLAGALTATLMRIVTLARFLLRMPVVAPVNESS